MRTSEKRTSEIRTNQGPGVHKRNKADKKGLCKCSWRQKKKIHYHYLCTYVLDRKNRHQDGFFFFCFRQIPQLIEYVPYHIHQLPYVSELNWQLSWYISSWTMYNCTYFYILCETCKYIQVCFRDFVCYLWFYLKDFFWV